MLADDDQRGTHTIINTRRTWTLYVGLSDQIKGIVYAHARHRTIIRVGLPVVIKIGCWPISRFTAWVEWLGPIININHVFSLIDCYCGANIINLPQPPTPQSLTSKGFDCGSIDYREVQEERGTASRAGASLTVATPTRIL